MKKKPENIKIDLFDILSNHLQDMIMSEITDYLVNKYGVEPSCFGYDTILKLNNIEWEE